jgi:hypothetical protein
VGELAKAGSGDAHRVARKESNSGKKIANTTLQQGVLTLYCAGGMGFVWSPMARGRGREASSVARLMNLDVAAGLSHGTAQRHGTKGWLLGYT